MKHITVFSLLLLSSVFFSCGEVIIESPCTFHPIGSVGYDVEIEGIPDRSKIGGFHIVYSDPEDPPAWFGPVQPNKKFLSESKQTPKEGQKTGPGSSDFWVGSLWRYCNNKEAIQLGFIPTADKIKIPYLSFVLIYDGTVYDGGPLLKYRYGQMDLDQDKVKESPRPEDRYYPTLDLGAGRYTVRFSDLEKNELKENFKVRVPEIP